MCMEIQTWAAGLADLSRVKGWTTVGGVHRSVGWASLGGLCVVVSGVDWSSRQCGVLGIS